MNIQTCFLEQGAITADLVDERVYIRLGNSSCMFLSTAEAVELIDAVANVLADTESPAVPIPL